MIPDGLTRKIPTHVTKYVSEANFAQTICGRIRIGTLSEYRTEHALAEARLTDSKEGLWQETVTEDLVDFTGNIGGMRFTNSSFVGGGGGSILNVNAFDAHVYCTSVGRYSQPVHEAIRRAGNESLDRYVTFRTDRLIAAISSALKHVSEEETRLVAERVQYIEGDKGDQYSAAAARRRFRDCPYRSNNEFAYKAIFRKPSHFSHEEEFRIAIIPQRQAGASYEPVLIRDLPRRFAEKIGRAVEGSGPR